MASQEGGDEYSQMTAKQLRNKLRTHIPALEDKYNMLEDGYKNLNTKFNVVKSENNALRDDNTELMELLTQHGIRVPTPTPSNLTSEEPYMHVRLPRFRNRCDLELLERISGRCNRDKCHNTHKDQWEYYGKTRIDSLREYIPIVRRKSLRISLQAK